MQGASIWGLILALASLGRCTVEELIGDLELPDLVLKLSVQEGLETLFDISLEDAQTKSIPESILHVVNKSLVFEKFRPLKKATGLFKKTEKKSYEKKSENITKIRTRRHTNDLKIPILPQLYTGSDEASSDNCERNEVLHIDGECHEILSQGPCEDDEYVLVDYDTKRGICAPRLCSPDRVFVFEDQKCHDPFEVDICPPGRQLTTSCFGTPVCICPDGTYEEEEDSEDEDVCQPILGKIESCSAGYVFWFDNFRSRPHCIPDPCAGINAKRGLDEMPYVPSEFDGKCYQVGQELPQCPSDTFYTLAFDRLKGICASLEDAGYLVTDGEEDFFSRLYGPRIAKPSSSRVKPSGVISPEKQPSPSQPRKIIKEDLEAESEIETTEEEAEHESKARAINPKIPSRNPVVKSGTKQVSAASLSFFERLARFLRGSRAVTLHKPPSQTQQELEHDEDEPKSRKKRDSLPYASPSFVFEPALASCRAGAIRGLNNKCRVRILPSRTPLSRPRRNVRVEPPVPICPARSFYSIRRKCVSNNGQIQANLLAQGLG